MEVYWCGTTNEGSSGCGLLRRNEVQCRQHFFTTGEFVELQRLEVDAHVTHHLRERAQEMVHLLRAGLSRDFSVAL